MTLLQRTGQFLAEKFRLWMPDPFVFAVLLTLVSALLSLFITEATPLVVLEGWYGGFWNLLEFGMQMVLILTTGFAIALSPPAAAFVNLLARVAHSPGRVYVLVALVGSLLSLISWGWGIITAVLARELAKRVSGIDYAYLTACVYLSSQAWVAGLSSSIPLLMNTEGNFMIAQGILPAPLAVSATLGSLLNLLWLTSVMIALPVLVLILQPHEKHRVEMHHLLEEGVQDHDTPVAEEAARLTGSSQSLSNSLNTATWISAITAVCGLVYVVRYFSQRGFDLNLNIMIFTFLMLGMLAHRTPMRYVVAMKRACSNISGIIYQYPFYAGIMGIMLATGLGVVISDWTVGQATISTLPLFAQAAGALVNFAIPSAGGEWAVVGPSLVEAAKTLGADLPPDQLQALIARVAMATAYGETSTNLIQPFFLLILLPVMGAGVRIQARDVMGYLILPFLFIYMMTGALIYILPL